VIRVSVLLVGAIAVAIAGQAQAERPSYDRCPDGPKLEGKLLATNVGCPAARRVSYGYFTHTQPGQHEGPARVGPWRCLGRWDGRDFRIKCRRPLPGPGMRRTKFVGVAG